MLISKDIVNKQQGRRFIFGAYFTHEPEWEAMDFFFKRKLRNTNAGL